MTMNRAYQPSEDRVQLPHVKIRHSLRANSFCYQVGFIEIDWNGVYMMNGTVQSYLEKPDMLISDLRAAVEVQGRMQHGDPRYAEYLKNVPPDIYWVYNGLMHATEMAPFDRETDDPVYLTVFQNDMRTWKTTAQTHYIRLDEHYRRFAGTHGQMMQIVKSIDTKIERGIEAGVQQAAKDSQMTLDQVYAEREKLEQQQRNIEERLKQLTEVEKTARSRSPRGVEGYVYLVQSPTTYYKIGRTVNPADRMKTFKVTLPFEVEFKHLIKTNDMYTLERDLHTKYAARRVNGEWFALTEDDVAEICAMKGGVE